VAEDWDDELGGEGLLIDRETADRFGVPLNIMGRHPEDFFSMLGRIVALAATLENKILVFYQYLVGRRQDEHTELGVGQLIANTLQELHRLPPADGDLAKEWLLEAKAITIKRNDYVHNMWPAQGDGRDADLHRRRGVAAREGGGALVTLTSHASMASLRMTSQILCETYRWRKTPFGDPAEAQEVMIRVRARSLGWNRSADFPVPVVPYDLRMSMEPGLVDRRGVDRGGVR